MCKFHKDVARDIATNPMTGEFDSARYCVALLAMAKYRTEQHVPALWSVDGYDPAKMLTPEAITAFDAAGIKKPIEECDAFRNENIGQLHRAMDLTAASCDISLSGLNIPDRITKDGYKHCDKMPADITKNGPFMDEAIVQLYTGYDDAAKTWARGTLTLVDEAHKPQFEAIRLAAEHFVTQPGVEPILQQMFANTLAKVFLQARATLDAGHGLTTDGCVMCGHGSRKNDPRPGA